VTDILPTAREIRRQEKVRLKAEAQAAYELRYEARRLLFGVAGGVMKNLPMKQQLFIREVIRKSYHAYLHDLATGVCRWNATRRPGWWKKLNPNRGKDHTLTFREYRVIWRKGNKAVYRRRDIPNMVKRKFEAMRNGGNPVVPQLGQG
jgi:hypothetical protein